MDKNLWCRCGSLMKKPFVYGCVVFILLGLFFTRQILNSNGVSAYVFVFVVIAELMVEFVLLLVLYKMRKRGCPLEKQFLIVAIVIGALFMIILPPGQSPDEITHFRRAYSIARGELIATNEVNDAGAIGSLIPKNTDFLTKGPEHGTYNMLSGELFRENDELSAQPYTSAALYNFVCYLPQSLAALVGRVLHMSVLATAYLMDIFNFIVWLVLVYCAIKIIPKFKSIVMFIALLPITMQEATSVSPDALTIGLSLFFVAYVMKLAYGAKKIIGKKDYVFLSVSALIIGFCKIVYLPLVFLMILIRYDRFGSKKRKWIFLGCLFVAVLILNLVWLMISSRYLLEYRPGVDSGGQLVGILTNPVRYLMVMFRTINVSGQGWANNLLGTTLGYFNFHLPYAIFLMSYTLVVLLFAQRDETLKMKVFDKVVCALVFLVIVGAIFTSLYIQWTAVGAEVIDGIQGRYFLPIILLLPLILCKTDSRKKNRTQVSDKVVLCYGVFVNIMACVTILAQNI